MARPAITRDPDPAPAGLGRRLSTPEGIELNLTLASAAERIIAFCLDGLIMIALLLAPSIAVLAFWVGGRGGVDAILKVIWLLAAFLLRNGFFVFFEASRRAATPGKRALGLRVIARDGGSLAAEAIFARNALRELEVFLPITLLLASAASGETVESAAPALALLWSGAFMLFPLFNRDRLRVGDLVAGTWVVRIPRVTLLTDLASGGEAAAPFAFTAEQVGAYGIKELEILATVLRRRDSAALAAVAGRIRARIGRPVVPGETDEAFLSAYYGALRARLEHRLLFGHRRKDKFDAP